MHIFDLDTPALVVDLDVLEGNIDNMASHCADLGIALAMKGDAAQSRVHLRRAAAGLSSDPLREQARRWLETLGADEEDARSPDTGGG